MQPIDTLDLADGARLSVSRDADSLAATPMVRSADGWRRARAGDGAAEALIAMLSTVADEKSQGRFTIRRWVAHEVTGERAVGVDQTNESVIVGDTAVVKWATHLQDGPHPAPPRISVLRDAGFTGMPAPWGVVTWQLPDGTDTVVASVDGYLPGAVDGWTWAVEDFTSGVATGRLDAMVAAVADVGVVVAEMHAALSVTAGVASSRDAGQRREDAFEVLETACALHELASARRADIEAELRVLGDLAGTPVLDGHGDLHVGQILRSEGRFVVTDFDGNPVLPAPQRILPIPAVLDVAGMVQSLAHAAIVARKYTDLDAGESVRVEAVARAAFLDSYRSRLADVGHDGLFDPAPLRAFRMQQVLREIIYAARHLPRWMYVPDAALPALLDEGT